MSVWVCVLVSMYTCV